MEGPGEANSPTDTGLTTGQFKTVEELFYGKHYFTTKSELSSGYNMNSSFQGLPAHEKEVLRKLMGLLEGKEGLI